MELENEEVKCPRCGHEIVNSLGEGEWGDDVRLKVNNTDILPIKVYTCGECGLVVMQKK